MLLQLLRDLDVLLVASWQELSQHVCSFTKALAQRPSKYVPLPRAEVDYLQGVEEIPAESRKALLSSRDRGPTSEKPTSE